MQAKCKHYFLNVGMQVYIQLTTTIHSGLWSVYLRWGHFKSLKDLIIKYTYTYRHIFIYVGLNNCDY